jgi:hypothetical protein
MNSAKKAMGVKSQQVSKPGGAKGTQASLGAKPRSRGFAGNHTLLKKQDEMNIRPALERSKASSLRGYACGPYSAGAYDASGKVKASNRAQRNPIQAEKINNIRSSSPRLLISHPSDRSEREADRVAHEVVRNSANSLGKLISKVSVQPMVSAKAQSRNHLSNNKDGAASGQSSEVSPQTEAQLRSAVGSGCPLPVPLRDFFDQCLDHDFSHVRIHTDQTAAETSQSLNAAAFTFGSDVFFNAGHFNPQTASGVGLIAHELTHVAQQPAGGISRQLIQRDKLPYHQLVWGDFTGQLPANTTSEGAGIWSSFGVPSSATFNPSVNPTKTRCNLPQPVKGRRRDVIWEGTGRVDPAQFDGEFQPYMDTAQSWALADIKDDGASYCARQVARCERDFTQNPRASISLGSARATSKADCSRRFRTACLSDRKKESDRLLAHEQWHFEITKVMSDKARTSFKAAAAAMNFTSRECGPKAAMDKLENDVDQPRKDLIAQGGAWVTLKNTVQDEYDLKTTHGTNTAKQQEWEGKIQAGLVDYNLPGPAATPPATTPTPPANPPATPAPTPQPARPAPAPPSTTK